MAIDIKEIFKSDLDPNSSQWFSSKKVEKLNHNFTQLSDGGNPGPLGEKGADGDYGSKGQKGDIGTQGYQGVSGILGEDGDSIWRSVIGSNNYTIFPKQPPAAISYSPKSLRIGVEYTDTDYSTANVQLGPLVEVYGENYGGTSTDYRKGIKFYHNAQIIGSLSVRSNTDTSSPNDAIVDDSAETAGVIREWYFNQIDFKGPSANILTIDLDNITFNTSTVFGDGTHDVTYNNSVKLTAGSPDNTKVLVGVDSLGGVQWQSKSAVFGSLPLGSIVAVNKAEWTSTNFDMTSTYLYETTARPALNNTMGKGINDFEGWYLCNGETWTNGSSLFSYEVPNLNSFDYTIDGNTGDQEQILNGGSDSPILVGGIDLSMTSSYQGSNNYSTTLTHNDNDDSITTHTSGGSEKDVNNLLWIINLENPNLFWVNASGGATVDPLDPITDVVYSDDQSDSCDANDPNSETTTIYLSPWDDATDTWEDTNQNMTGVYMFEDDIASTLASAGYYQKNGLVRYWNGVDAFTTFYVCPTVVTLYRENSIMDLNGDSSTDWATEIANGSTVDVALIGGSTFATATSVLSSSTLNKGWYREVGVSNGVRRFFDATNWIGEVFELDYVHYIGEYEFSTSYTNSICTQSGLVSYDCFVEQTSITPLYNTNASCLAFTSGKTLYVNATSGTNLTHGNEAIYNSKDSASPTISYNTLKGDTVNGSNYASISTNATLGTAQTCPSTDNQLLNASGIQVGSIVESTSNWTGNTDNVQGGIIMANTTGTPAGPDLKLTLVVPPWNGGGNCITPDVGVGSSHIFWNLTIRNSANSTIFTQSEFSYNTSPTTSSTQIYDNLGLSALNNGGVGTYSWTLEWTQYCGTSTGTLTIELSQ